MLRSRRLPALILCSAAALAACGDGGTDGSQGSEIDTRPPPKPPAVDRDAGAPAFVAHNAERHVLLDAAGRVARVLPKTLGIEARPCRGGRVWVDVSSYDGRLVVRTVDGDVLWRRQVPVSMIDAARCMDSGGRRIALVRQYERSPPEGRSYWFQRLLVVSRRGVRTGPRFIGTTPLLEPDRIYVVDERGVQIRDVPSWRLLRHVPGEAGIHDISPSPDRRFAVLTWAPDITDIFLLADLSTGSTRRIEIPRMQVVGWLAPDRLVVRADRKLIVLDPQLREVTRVEGFRPTAYDSTIVDGEVIALDGTRLIAVRPGAGPPRTLGTVPEGTESIAGIDDVG